MPWCCADFERHLGRFDDDGLRVDYALKFPPWAEDFLVEAAGFCRVCKGHFDVPVVGSGSCVLSDRRLSSLGALQVALASKRIRKIEGVRAARRQLPVTPSIDHDAPGTWDLWYKYPAE